jgi:two-component system, response regulator
MILLVEDNADDERLAVRALRNSVPDVVPIVARDGVEALERLSDDSILDRLKFVMLDLKLPKLSGLEVLSRIREDERTRHLPVIVFTSSAELRDLNEAYRLGANSFLQKPVEFSAFNEIVEYTSKYWLRFNRAVPHGTATEPL